MAIKTSTYVKVGNCYISWVVFMVLTAFAAFVRLQYSVVLESGPQVGPSVTW